MDEVTTQHIDPASVTLAASERLRRRTGIRAWTPRGVAIVAALALIVTGWSYASALTAPGTDSMAARSVEWLRFHGMSRLVVEAERLWYGHHPPPVGGKPSSKIPGTGSASSSAPVAVATIAKPALPGEGVWHAMGRRVGGRPVLFVTAIRPDTVHTSLLTGIARIDVTATRTVMYAGTRVPGGTGWRDMAPIPVELRPTLVAAFNSGFRLQESRGGYYQEGRLVSPMVDGQATLVIRPDGSATVAKWGRDAVMGAGVAEARQNLDLIVDHSLPAPALNEDWRGRWGYTLGNGIYVWRSGLGVARDGSLLFASGPGLTARSLADVLVAAGAVRAMELDINSQWTDFFWFNSPDPAHPDNVASNKLLPGMHAEPDRYFRINSKDFIAVFTR